MNRRVKKFLSNILDGEWHVFEKLPRDIGVITVESCIEQGFVITKMVDRKRKGNVESYRTALRITNKGKDALKKDHNT